MNEIWKPIPKYELRYEASSMGRIRIIGPDSWGRKTCVGRIVSPGMGTNGYLGVCLSQNGEKKSFSLHRLIALTFLGETDLETVNHKNGIKTDNRLSNLEYATRVENQQHALKALGFQPRFGNNHPHVRLSDSQVLFIRGLAKDGAGGRELSEMFNYSHGGMCDIINGKSRVKVA